MPFLLKYAQIKVSVYTKNNQVLDLHLHKLQKVFYFQSKKKKVSNRNPIPRKKLNILLKVFQFSLHKTMKLRIGFLELYYINSIYIFNIYI